MDVAEVIEIGGAAVGSEAEDCNARTFPEPEGETESCPGVNVRFAVQAIQKPAGIAAT